MAIFCARAFVLSLLLASSSSFNMMAVNRGKKTAAPAPAAAAPKFALPSFGGKKSEPASAPAPAPAAKFALPSFGGKAAAKPTAKAAPAKAAPAAKFALPSFGGKAAAKPAAAAKPTGRAAPAKRGRAAPAKRAAPEPKAEKAPSAKFGSPLGRYTSILPSFVLKQYGASESGQPDIAKLQEAGYTGKPFWKPTPPKKIKVVNPDSGVFGRIFIQPKFDEDDEVLYGRALTELEQQLIAKGQVDALTGPAKALFLGASRTESNRRGDVELTRGAR